MNALLKPFITLLALLLLAYEWLWELLKHQMQRLRRWPAVLRMEARAKRLSPWASLAVMALPLLVLLPFKMVALWALAHGQELLGVSMYVLAKVVGMSLISYLFDLVRDGARQLPWFDRLYSALMRLLMRAKAWVHARPVYQAAKAWAQRVRGAIQAWRGQARSPWARRLAAAKAALKRR